MFEGGNTFPRLKGKAAECKCFLSPLKHVFEAYCDSSCVQHQQVISMLDLAEKLEHMLEVHKADYTLPAAVAKQFLDHCHGFVQFNAAHRPSLS